MIITFKGEEKFLCENFAIKGGKRGLIIVLFCAFLALLLVKKWNLFIGYLNFVEMLEGNLSFLDH